MAKKKSSKQKATQRPDFSNSPFKSLKGLSASEPAKAKAQDGAAKQVKTAVPESPVRSMDQGSFAAEMDFLGVKPLPERVFEQPDSVKNATAKAKAPPTVACEKGEAAVFLDAIGSMEKTFKDEWAEADLVKPAVPRRMKQVERGQLKPQAELDLHGLSVDEASAKIIFFLQDAVHQGFQTVLVITGKGLHSNDGPVLRQAMEKLLNQQRKQVVEWGVAPRRYGGDGALVVFLRRVEA